MDGNATSKRFQYVDTGNASRKALLGDNATTFARFNAGQSKKSEQNMILRGELVRNISGHPNHSICWNIGEVFCTVA